MIISYSNNTNNLYKNMKHLWSIICQNSAIDFEKNLLSLFNCLEELNLVLDKDKIPEDNKVFVGAEFQLISFWEINDNSKEHSVDMRVEFVNPDNEILNSFSNSFNVKSGISRFRNRTNIKGLPVKGGGKYYLKVFQNIDKKGEELVSSLPLDIKINYKIMDVAK